MHHELFTLRSKITHPNLKGQLISITNFVYLLVKKKPKTKGNMTENFSLKALVMLSQSFFD